MDKVICAVLNMLFALSLLSIPMGLLCAFTIKMWWLPIGLIAIAVIISKKLKSYA